MISCSLFFFLLLFSHLSFFFFFFPLLLFKEIRRCEIHLLQSSNVHVACIQLHMCRTTENHLNMLVLQEKNISLKKVQVVKENGGLSAFVSALLYSLACLSSVLKTLQQFHTTFSIMPYLKSVWIHIYI